VIFGRNNLVQDAPISRLDLLICRNTLMYFNAETQAGSCATSTSRCDDGGVLMLGKSEMMISHRDCSPRRTSRCGSSSSSRGDAGLARERRSPAERGARDGDDDRASRDAALELGPHAHVIVSRTGR
jgi:two-component system CheB/CheR fusion protein